MNEIEYVFNSDIREKKRTARGSRNKKCGAKSKKCSLPYETMKRKDLKAMNGSVINYKLSEFYSWDEFLAMPSDIQVEYINRMSEHYNIGLSTLSVTLFGKKDDQTLRKHFMKAGLMEKLKVEKHHGGHVGRIRLVDDMRKAAQPETDPEQPITGQPLPSLKTLAEDAKKSVVTIGERRIEHANEVKRNHDKMVQEIHDLSESGLSNREIADKLDVPESTVRNYTKSIGDELIEEARELSESGFSNEEIVDRIGVPESTIRNYVKFSPSYLRDLMLEMDGFDLDALQFLAHKYENKKIKLTVTVAVVE